MKNKPAKIDYFILAGFKKEKMRECLFYKKEEDDLVRCRACHHFCRIKPGQAGVCGVRKNVEGELQLLVYGHPVSIAVDPIEKKPFYHFLPGSYALSLGTFGCNFRCANCQNYDISQQKNEKIIRRYFEGQAEISPEEIIQSAKENDCQSVAYTYNEPTIWTEYALAIMKLAHKNNLKNVWVSNGYFSDEVLEKITPYLDAINVDIKSYEDKFYRKYAGARLNPVLENVKKIKKRNIHLEITTLIIPTLSDDLEMLKNLASFIIKELGTEMPWHISAFSSIISWKLRDLPDTEPEKIKKICAMAKKMGLRNVYEGNV